MLTTPTLFADHTLVDDDETAGQLAAMVRGQLRSGHDVADLLDHVAELDRLGSWALSGHRSCAAWLSATTGARMSTAATWVRVARRLETRPALAAALRSDELSYTKVRILTQTRTHLSDAQLLLLARGLPASALAIEIAALTQAVG